MSYFSELNRAERLQRNFSYFTVNLPLEFSEIFNIFRITVFFFLLSEYKKFKTKLKTIVISKPVDERATISKKTTVHGILQYGIKQNSLTLLVYDLEI